MKPSTERDYYRRIARVIEAILAGPGAPHTLESLASLAHLSPFHFHRIYHALTGESIVETVQCVRLAQAAHRLTVAGDSVTTVAGNVGYESPQAFSRAFRGFAGVIPSAFQTRQRRLNAPSQVGHDSQTQSLRRPRPICRASGWSSSLRSMHCVFATRAPPPPSTRP